MVEQKSRHGDYFEGILQLRNPNKEVFDYIDERFRERSNCKIVKEKKVKNGFDLYFDNQKFLQSLGKKLKEKFNAILKISSKLYSVSKLTSKPVYRVTVLIKIPHFKVNQIIKLQGKLMKVLEIKNKVKLKEEKTGKKHILDFDYINERVK